MDAKLCQSSKQILLLCEPPPCAMFKWEVMPLGCGTVCSNTKPGLVLYWRHSAETGPSACCARIDQRSLHIILHALGTFYIYTKPIHLQTRLSLEIGRKQKIMEKTHAVTGKTNKLRSRDRTRVWHCKATTPALRHCAVFR